MPLIELAKAGNPWVMIQIILQIYVKELLFNGTFEGNGWTISDLNISRSGEDCVGLFGHVAADAMIRNLTLHAEAVVGGFQVGGLVGWGQSAQIVSISVMAAEV